VISIKKYCTTLDLEKWQNLMGKNIKPEIVLKNIVREIEMNYDEVIRDIEFGVDIKAEILLLKICKNIVKNRRKMEKICKRANQKGETLHNDDIDREPLETDKFTTLGEAVLRQSDEEED
jgi:hypothetical protein